MKTVPRYQQVMDYYQALIESGKLAEGEKMPTEDELCNLFNISRITVRRALDSLMQEGYIYKVQGKGSFVTVKKTDMQLNRLQGFSEEMRSLGLAPSTDLIHIETQSPTQMVANALGITLSQKIYCITRLRKADDIPIAIERVHIPFFRYPGLENFDLKNSLYDILLYNYDCKRSKAVQSIKACQASDEDAAYLGIKSGKAVLQITRTTFEQKGIPFEYVQSIYRGDKYQFNVVIEE